MVEGRQGKRRDGRLIQLFKCKKPVFVTGFFIDNEEWLH